MTQRNLGKRVLKLAGFAAAALALLVGGVWAYYRWTYPYGFNHCCDKGIILALCQYAEDHGGRFPVGEATPEASFSLLYPKYADAYWLRGKTVPEEAASTILESGGRLTPETCDWHYVEGLTVEDNSRIALFWDKVGLGHNGERLAGGGHSVGFVGGYTELISGADWPAFLAEQDKLLARRKPKKNDEDDQPDE